MTSNLPLSRRAAIAGALAAGGVALSPVRAQDNGAPFSRVALAARARNLAASTFDDRLPSLPTEFQTLDYDGYRKIRFKNEAALLDPAGAYRMHLQHPGFLFKRPVAINIVRSGISTRVEFSTAMFDYGGNALAPEKSPDIGFAGFKLLYPLNQRGNMDELISFLGASYFRFLGSGDRYGLSARSLAIGVGGSEPEEFPFFREFWLEQPEPGINRITVHALLDSPSLAGVYTFILQPDAPRPVAGTAIDITATLFTRRAVKRIGIAPMTSMYFSGENDPHKTDDFRPEVHDSDGLLVHNGVGEWIWRPLRNPHSISFSAFMDKNPRGFGLLQRDHSFEHYEDLEADYHQRPSYWVEPAGDWGEGRIELVEFAAADETSDNINAYWTPSAVIEGGQSLDLAYRITAVIEPRGISPNGIAVATYHTNTKVVGTPDPVKPNERRFLIDFSGQQLAALQGDTKGVELVVSTTKGDILRTFVAPNSYIGGVRAGFDVSLEPGQATDLRAFLLQGNSVMSETWTYPWENRNPGALAR